MAVIEDVCQHLFSPSTCPASGGGDGSVASCLHGANGEEVQPCPVDEPVLGEGEESPRIGKEGGIRVEGHGVKCSPLIFQPLDGIHVALLQSFLECLV